MNRIARSSFVAGVLLLVGGLALLADPGFQIVVDPHAELEVVAVPDGRPARLHVAAASPAWSGLLDRETATTAGVGATSDIDLQLEHAAWISGVKVYGAADGTVTVLAESGSGWVAIPGLTSIPLSALAPGWNELQASQPVFASRVRLRWVAGAGARRSLAEVEVWGPVTPATPVEAASLAAVGAIETHPDLRGLAGTTEELTISANEASATLHLADTLTRFRRIFLCYELRGWQEWVSVSRSINGEAPSRAAIGGVTQDWTQQVEEIDPRWLRPGANSVRFTPAEDAVLPYDVRNVRLMAEVDTGRNAVDGTRELVLIPAVGAAERVVTMTFDSATQLSGLDVYSLQPTVATARVEALVGDVWETVLASGNSSDLAPGWTFLPLSERRPVTAVRVSGLDVARITPVGSTVGPAAAHPSLRVTYPTDGRFHGREAHLRGFVRPFDNGSGTAEVWVAGSRVDRDDGSFAVTVSKDDLGLFDEADADPWSVEVRAVFPNGRVVVREVALDGYRPGPESIDGRLLPPRSLRAEPHARKRMSHDAATLDVEAGSVDSAVDLSITPLDDSGLAALDPGMTNVTRGPRRGYRFQPHGMRFKKPVEVQLPYDPQRIPPGLTEEDVRTFYFDEESGRWKPLERVEIDAASRKVVSRTDHFTDMINATITVPDHPTPLSFNPNSIRSLEAANPAQGVNFVEPPEAGPKGDARLSFPIEVPPGRLGMTPQLSLRYDSSKANGWVGVGWDLAVPSITVDTRWGVPRYCSSTSALAVCPDGAVESETYLLAGEQLTPVAHRAPFQPRSAERVFRTRIEGAFSKVVRHGDHPSNYSWEVTDKAGTRFLYGGPGATLADAAGNVFTWALTESRDLSGNGIAYEYAKVFDPGVAGGTVDGTQLYLKRVNYTRSGGAPGAYTVTFLRDAELPGYVRRPDVTIDARGGFKMVTSQLLQRIDVDFDGGAGPTRIRSYDLGYARGAFEKTLLETVTQRGTKEQEFHTHRFTYFDDVREGAGYVGFAPAETWDTGSDDVRLPILDDIGAPLGFDDGKATALSGYETENVGAHVYVGYNQLAPTKQGSTGFKYGAGGTVDSSGLLTMIDLDGDRLPDKVFRRDDDILVRLNRSGPHGTTDFGPAVVVATLPSIGRESTFTTSFGGETYLAVSVMGNTALSFTTTPVYFADVNGDGLPDLVDHGAVLFNRPGVDGTPAFLPDSATSPVPVGPAEVDGTDLLPDYGDLEEQALANAPLHDTVRRWVAPFPGTVQVSGDVTLGPPDPAYRTADGVRVAIQHNGTELWSGTIEAEDGAAKTPTGVDAVAVAKGDRIYFRVHSRFDGRHDAVLWDPRVVYTGAPVASDVNLLDPYRFQASSDFTLAGRRGIDVKLPFTGKVRLTGDLQKTGTTTDDVTLLVFKGDALAVPPATLAWSSTGTIPLDLVLDVVQDERIELRVKVDSSIDLGKISWVPAMHYLDTPLPTQVLNGVERTITRVFDAAGNPIVRLDPPYDIDAYSEDALLAPQAPWVVPDDGAFTVHSTLIADPKANGTAILTAKKRGVLLAKRAIAIVDGVAENVAFELDLEEDDQVFFDYSCFDPDLAPLVGHRIVEVDDGSGLVEVPSAFRHAIRQGVFPQPYRGWAVVGYKGDPPRDEQPIVEADFVQDFDSAGAFDPRTAKAFLFAPRPSGNRWLGPEEQTFVTPQGAGSSRVGVDFVQAPTATASGSAQAPLRVSHSTQVAASVGALFLSGSASTGDGSSDLDFLDMNGDQFPDVVGTGRVQYSPMFGGLEAANRPVGGFEQPRATASSAQNIGVGGSPAQFELDGGGRVDSSSHGPAGRENDTGSQMVTLGLGVSGSLGSGSSSAEFDLVDLNGDGLPDRVTQVGGQLRVAFNLGYAFAPVEPWGSAALNAGESSNASIGPTLGFNGGIYDFAGGLSFDRNTSKVTRDLVDVNGDGFPDRLTTVGSELRVGLNTGAGFLADTPWTGGPSSEFARSGSTSLGGGVYFTVGIGPLCLLGGCYVIVNPGADGGTSLARQETTLSDVDGDGYLDHLASSRDDAMTVARNTTGRSNLLRRVERPMGAVIDLDYAREGNTYDQPQTRWVLSRIGVFDGFAADGADHALTTFRYEGGVYDRLEREFYGFGKVIEEHRDAAAGDALYRSIEREYATGSFYTSGLLVKQTLRDGAGRPFTETENTYVLRDEADGTAPADPKSTTATEFPQLARVERRYFEGQPAPGKTTAMSYEYDLHGNTTRLVDFGDVGPADDVDAAMTYSDCAATHLFGAATAIEVKGGGATMRRREATVDCASGDVTQIREYLGSGAVATSDMAYSARGNLVSLRGPANHRNQRYTLQYAFDPVTETHVTSIVDSYGLASAATHDPLFGRPTSHTDAAGNVTSLSYDTFGRTATITAPYEQGTGSKTIRFEYHPAAAVPWARTRHIDPYRSVADTIDAVTFADGLARTLQIKNDAAVQGVDRVIVSGRVAFDAFGRTISKRYPTVESLGTPAAFNPTPDPVAPTTMAFDVLDRTLESRIPDGARTTTAYGFGADRQGRPQFERVVTDANGIVKRTYSDVRELIVGLKETNRGGTETIWTSYDYDPLRQLVSIADDRDNVTRIEYDNLGRRTAIDSPDMGKVDTAFDLAGNAVGRVTPNLRPRGLRIDFEHDFLRIASIRYPDFPGNNVTYAYGSSGAPENGAGRVVRVQDESGITERGYGKLGEVVRETKTVASDTQGNGPNSPEVYTTRWVFDSFNRLQNLTYPDGELLTYRYDSGGKVRAASGVKGPNTYAYLNRLEYDKFEERVLLEAGNGVRTAYAYRPDNRRLESLTATTPSSRVIQSFRYTHDPVGNVLRLQNQVAIPPASQFGGPTDMAFSYDDLYRLTGATGVYQFAPNKSRRFVLAMDYDTIHNITTKIQSDVVVEPSGSTVPQQKTSYAWTYAYGGPQPHAATHLGERTFAYDANGNQAGFTHDRNGTRRTIVWDEENRIQTLADNGHTETYKYDDDGERVIKRGPQGETVYVNPFFTVRNREVGTKHVFAGETRLVSKLVKPGTVYEKDLYFYHPDHIGSTSFVTDAAAQLYEHIEYFPFGETWVEEASNIQRTPYRFTAKELDEETGLTYFGARYFDPRTSVWQSPDPQLPNYLPVRGNTDARDLPGQGGVFDPVNLALYGYAGLNPLKLKDHDGLDKETVEKIAKAISADMDKAWKASFNSDGTTKEQGSAIVVSGGSFKAKNASKQSTSENVSINTDVDAGEKLAGTFHTHPFGQKEGGHLGVAHSLDDIDAIGKGTKGRYTFIEAGSKRYVLEIVDKGKFKAFAASEDSVNTYYKAEMATKGDKPQKRFAAIRALARHKDSGLKLYQSTDKEKVKFEEVK